MKLSTRTISIVVGSVVITAVAAMVVQRTTIRKQGLNLTKEKMRSVVLVAENARASMSDLQTANAFDRTRLVEQARNSASFRDTALYKTVPVVAAWNGIKDAAKQENFRFRVPSFNPRNPENKPSEFEADLLRKFKAGEFEEYFGEDNGDLVFARPIRLTEDCMTCHGDRSRSPTGDGKDVLGIPMEGWHAGEMHGAFVLRTEMSRVDDVVHAASNQAAGYLAAIAAAMAGVAWLLMFKTNAVLRRVAAGLSAGADAVRAAAAQVASSSTSLATSASEHAAALQETSASTHEISSLSDQNSDDARKVLEAVQTSNTRIAETAESVKQMTSAMASIANSSNKISGIMGLIDDIAFQTNMLALNAAIEASRAGEAGLGFAVVADEVRRLAERCKQSADESRALVDQSQSSIGQGQKTLDAILNHMADVTQSSAQIRELVEQVESSSRQQSQSVTHVGEAVMKLEMVSQSSAAIAEENAACAEELSAQSADITNIVETLMQVVDGKQRVR